MEDVTPVPERWLPIPDYEHLYEVSDQGRIRCLKKRSGKVRNWPYLTPSPVGSKGKQQHLGVDLYSGGERWSIQVHVLVMLAFVGPRPPGEEVRHLDGNAFNNRLENLEYGTPRENAQDSIAHGTFKNITAIRNAGKTHCPQDHEYTEENTFYKVHYKTGTLCRQCRACDRARCRAYKQRKRRERLEAA